MGKFVHSFCEKDKHNLRKTQAIKQKTEGQRIIKTILGALAEMAKTCDIPTGEDEWIRDIFINNMKNSDIQRKLLTETLPPLKTLNVALIDEKRITNHIKMTSTFKSNGYSSNKSFNHFNVKREPTLNIKRTNTCMKCGGNFTKGHLAVCPAKDTTCTTCKYRGHFSRLCKSRRKIVNIVDSQIVNNTDCNYPSEQPDVNIDRANRECCGVINAWSESGQSDNDDYSVLNVTTIYDDQGKELKKLLNIGLGNENQVIFNIQVDSTSPLSFLKQNVLHELKLRDPYVKIYPVDKATKELYCGFTNNAINNTGKVIVPNFSNEWSHKECHFFLTQGHERNILGNDNLPKVGIEVSQKQYTTLTNKRTCKSINSVTSLDIDNEKT